MNMKIWAVAFMFLAGLISCQSNAASSSENTTQHTQESTVAVSLNTEEWAEKMNATPGKVIDVRTKDEYADGYIDGAVNVDVLDASFVSKLEKLSLNKSEAVYVYCRSGSRSKKAMSILKEQGFVEIYELNSGIIGWEKAGNPIKK